MHAVRYHDHGGPEQLTVEELDRPEPAAGELLIRVAAAGVNPVDTYFRDGEYPVPELPWVPGCDAAGEVVAVGDGVNEFTVGDRVVATGLGRTISGACAEYVTAPTGLAAQLLDEVGFEAAAALALVGTTAWQAFVHHGDVELGERVLVHGANGGVGHVAIQLARAMGAEVTATARPVFEADLQALGADAVVDYRTDDLADALAAPGAPDVVLGTVANETIVADAAAAAHGARIIAIGNTDATVAVPMGPSKFKELQFQAMSMFNTPDTGAVLGTLAGLVARGDVEPVIAATYDLDEVADAHRDVLEESFLGKLVVTP
jgi:NADPH:quinone reductase-like Zn-dependent oxidoreductase